MEISKTVDGGITVLALSGRLDTNTAPQLQDVLIPEFDTSHAIELDFSQLSYISSAGLRVLLMGQKTAQAKGSAMTLSHVSGEVMDVFEMTGFSNILTIR